MKRIIISTLMSLMIISMISAQNLSERTGYEGDFFSLEGAIELFKDSRSLHDFERKLNSKNSYVNNLDLDYDGRIDFVRVEHRRQGDFHAIILQVPINRHDAQDVAVIEIEKTGRREAVLQIIGDPDLYGQEVVVEPFEGSRTSRGGELVSDSYVNVYYWPVIQNIYGRDYVVYSSPYRWNYYPTWWVTWRPFSWNVYYTRVRPYYGRCRVVTIYRTPHVHRFYRPHRRYSTHVAHRTERVRVDRAKSHRAYGNATRSYDQDRYGSGIKRNAPSRDLSQRREVQRQAPTSRQRPNETRSHTPSNDRKGNPGRNMNQNERSYRQAPNNRSTDRAPSKVITPRKSGDQVNRSTAHRQHAPTVKQRSSGSTQRRSYAPSPARQKAPAVKRSAPGVRKSTPQRGSVKSNSKSPSRKSSSASRSSRKH